ncbi:hypothetical protein KG879_000675 [Salmonella enterica]|uniref:hypothetical protein n=1 Tax=Salmonella enterica TaxID=28901 RepID=UPI0009AEB48F|nr:hypothetical protein [Salmonella enterica]EAA2779736.1 hypothetical protein [Salmonella enterica subsp. enterica serovar Montevideo]EDB4490606.1 hypothetical protein [Salmonella enterica subsp. enterica serovar Rubislaw]EDM7393209.1 hypothetical protein [Salmonella enterica subsp. enterica serovar Schwarzengrund]EDN0385996.1 hypothetical protein [Salmonella enterica subsp. enterica serovar Newport]EDQ7358955.1 hypothetical protein [Salmonella enterica subsp. enterica serovar Carrau]EDW3874
METKDNKDGIPVQIENANNFGDYFSDFSGICTYTSGAGNFVCFNFLKTYVHPPFERDGEMFAPEIGLQRVASVSMTEEQAHNLYKLLGDILHHQKVRGEDR